MSITYAVVGKKTYEDLVTNKDKYVYEVPSISEDLEEAKAESNKYMAMSLCQMNRNDSGRRLKEVDSKVIPFEGLHKIEDVRKVIDIASKNEKNMDIIMSKGR